MGLKTTNYEIKNLGITLDNAYARIYNVSIDSNGVARAIIAIQRTREASFNKTALENKALMQKVNKSEPIYTQLYNLAKEKYLKGWEDDIVEDEIIV